MLEKTTPIKIIRATLDAFCDEHKLSIGSPAALDAARTGLALGAANEYTATELLAAVDRWYREANYS